VVALLLFSAAFVPLTANAAVPASVPAASADKDNKLVLLFDSSGSMADPDAAGQTKMDAAKHAFHELIPKLPAGAHVGLRVYGAKVFAKTDPGACQDSQSVVPVGPVDKAALGGAVDNFRPYGETPIAHSLREAAKDLGTSGKRTILLVSDGEETCDPNPCATAREISGLGIDLKIDVVGFKVDEKASKQLRCITDAGNGTYYNTDDAEDLVESLQRLAVRAFRPFRVDGRAIQGSSDKKPSGPVLTAGKYVDAAPALQEAKYYRLRRTIPGSTLHVGATARPAPGEQMNTLKLETTALDGRSCGYGTGSEVSYANTNPLVTAAVSSWDELTADNPGCSAGDLILTLRQDGSKNGAQGDNLKGVPVEVVVVEEPPIKDQSLLDEKAPSNPRWRDLPAGAGEEITPGASFSDSPKVGPGQYRTSLFPGEVQFVKVRLNWGQRLQAEAKVAKPDAKLAGQTDYPQPLDLRLIAPTRGAAQAYASGVIARDTTMLEDDKAVRTVTSTLAVTYGNRAAIDREHKNSSVAGDYYIAISLGRDKDNESYVVPVDVGIAVEGATGGFGTPIYSGTQALLGPGVDGVSGVEKRTAPPSPKPADSAEQSRPDTSTTAAAPAEQKSLTPGRLILVIVLSAIVFVLVIVMVVREIVRRRSARQAAFFDSPF
jgi:Ca-activated chloride channel family protein